jgi:TRAP-type C4-dicarboxylate transport system permease small subunit
MVSVMMKLARTMAILGGIVLALLILIVCISVIGRTSNGVLHTFADEGGWAWAQWLLDVGVGPVTGDFELVEAGIAFAIFAFMPLCQMSGGHASVDIFTSKLPVSVNRFLSMVIEAIFAAVLVLITVKLFDGMISKKGYGETTFLLQFPVWWSYAASFAACVVAALVAVYMALVRGAEFFRATSIIAEGEGADH